MSRFLEKERFLAVVNDTPLVAIDLIVVDETGQVLLGQRCNRPAQGYWFVPGGRIQKDESLDDAFKRLTQVELGVTLTRAEAQCVGVYEHFYADNFANSPNITTHYVVIAHQLTVARHRIQAPLNQHNLYKWCAKENIAADFSVHENTRAYF